MSDNNGEAIQAALPLVDGHGMPIRICKRGRGRPAFEKTSEIQRLVAIMLTKGASKEEIAAAISCSVRTLERYFSPELERAGSARLLAEARNVDRLMNAADKGNVSAMVQIDKKLDRWAIAAPQAKPKREPKVRKLGKKEQIVAEAHEASQSGEWGSLLKH